MVAFAEEIRGTSCALPRRYAVGGAQDALLVETARALGAALEGSVEFREFVRLTEAVNADPQVAMLVHEIRGRRASYGLSESSGLAARLEALPVMVEYRAAEKALRELFNAVDELIGKTAGTSFCEHVKPQGHG
jgi:cell fate (sporulation/competence/biofilm development) regulator YlbF (YheA/YmcA/DUF963 family)